MDQVIEFDKIISKSKVKINNNEKLESENQRLKKLICDILVKMQNTSCGRFSKLQQFINDQMKELFGGE